MIVGLGVDLVQNSRIKKALTMHKIEFIKKILTKKELAELLSIEDISVPHLAGIFAAKEAVIKSLSKFLGFSLNFQQITVKKDNAGIPNISIESETERDKLSQIKLTISISHETNSAIALAIAEIVGQ